MDYQCIFYSMNTYYHSTNIMVFSAVYKLISQIYWLIIYSLCLKVSTFLVGWLYISLINIWTALNLILKNGIWICCFWRFALRAIFDLCKLIFGEEFDLNFEDNICTWGCLEAALMNSLISIESCRLRWYIFAIDCSGSLCESHLILGGGRDCQVQ